MAQTEKLGAFTLHLPDGVFPLGGDSLALGRVCDLGCGGGTLLLLLADRAENLRLTGVELDKTAACAARDNLSRNGLTGDIYTGDLRLAPFPAGQFDLVISNPPYFAVGSGTSGGSTRCEEDCSLDQLCDAASKLVKNGGRFALCHRPERLCDVLCALRKYGLEPKRLQFLSHSPAPPPPSLLVLSVGQSQPRLTVLPALFSGGSQP